MRFRTHVSGVGTARSELVSRGGRCGRTVPRHGCRGVASGTQAKCVQRAAVTTFSPSERKYAWASQDRPNGDVVLAGRGDGRRSASRAATYEAADTNAPVEIA